MVEDIKLRQIESSNSTEWILTIQSQTLCQQIGQIFAIALVLLFARTLFAEFRLLHHYKRFFDDRGHDECAILLVIVRWICGHIFCGHWHELRFVWPLGHFHKSLLQTHFNHIQWVILTSSIIVETNIAGQAFDFDLEWGREKERTNRFELVENPKKVHRRELNERKAECS